MSAPEDIPSTEQVGLSIPADIRQLGERLVTPGRHRRTETRTSVGESEALIAAAGEYVRRMDRARQGLEEMRALGVQIDEAAVKAQRDERLEAIASILPAVDELLRERERLTDDDGQSEQPHSG